MNYNDEKVVVGPGEIDVRSADDLHITMSQSFSITDLPCVHEIARRRLQERVAVKCERKSHWASSAHFLSLLSAKKAWLTILAAASYELVIVLPKPRRCC